MGEAEQCECYWCTKHRQLARAKINGDFKHMTALAEEFGNRAVCAEAEMDYYNCIMDGSWPTAVEILEKALEKARNPLT